MKKVLLVILFLFFFFLTIFPKAEASCLRMQGTIGSSTNFPAGGNVVIKCAGDIPEGPSHCTGDNATLAPGQTYDFQKCSCLGAGKCLEVVSVPATCTYTLTGNYCGTNGNTIYPDVNVSCPAPETPCPKGVGYCGSATGTEATSCPYGAEPTSFLDDQKYTDWCGANTGGTRKYCFSACKPAPVTSPSPSPSATPTISPTTSPPVSTPTVGTPPPVSTPTSTTPPGGTPTLPPATATPKPPFSEEACKCVGLDVTSLSPGKPFTATAKGKVVGSDMDKAKLISFKFFLYKGTDTSSSMLPISEIPTSVIVDTAGGVANYTATWNATFPTEVDPNITYRIQAQKKCVPKSIGMASSNKVVLGTKTESQGLFEIFFAFINRILGRKEKVVQNAPTPTPAPASLQTTNGTSVLDNDGSNRNIQLGTFYPGEIIDQSCSFIKFKFASKN